MTIFLFLMALLFSRRDKEERTDEALVTAYKQGDQEALGQLFTRYLPIIFGICMKYLKDETAAEDASMQVYEQLRDKLLLHDVQHFGGWLSTLVRNHCLMQLRKQQTAHKQHLNWQQTLTDDVESDPFSHPEAEKEAELTRMADALQELPEQQRVCLELFFLQELSYSEVMDRTGYTFNEVKSFIQNGKRNLRKRIAP
jgi:RNA polymerase sigma-70 factor (ECF subfamily)